MLRCLRSYNLPINDLLAIYKGYVRPVLDYCVPLFNGNLTKEQVNKLERVQKRVCRIIFGNNYSSYRDAFSVFKLETLENRTNCVQISLCQSNPTICVEVGYLPKEAVSLN